MGAALRADAPGRGVMTSGTGMQNRADNPGQTVAAPAGAAAAVAPGNPGRTAPAGLPDPAPRDGIGATGSPGMAGRGQQAAQAQFGAQGPTSSGPETTARGAGSAAAAAPERGDGTAPRSGDPLAAGVQQAQVGAPASGEAPGPRAAARAAESAQAASSAPPHFDAVARTASGVQTIMTAQGQVGVAVGAGAQVSYAGPVGPGSEDGPFGADPLATEFGPGEMRGPGRSAAADVPVLPAAAQTPRQVTLQIAEMVRASGQR
ncbi:MAG: hypothetical protein KDK28_22345, partial [Maritimibacter sp.]|nr:hypothetical protein [Maritimibacter sp.]